MVMNSSISKNSLIQPHHSAADWDIIGTYTMDTSIYVSAPTSFRQTTSYTGLQGILCKNSSCLCLPQGSLITYLRTDYNTSFFYFEIRNTAVPGVNNSLNCYQVDFALTANTWKVSEYSAGLLKRSFQTSKTVQLINTWYKFRLIWWLTDWGLTFQLDLWDGSKWVRQGDLLFFVDPLHGSATFQRVGIKDYRTMYSPNIWLDDTEIWAPS